MKQNNCNPTLLRVTKVQELGCGAWQLCSVGTLICSICQQGSCRARVTLYSCVAGCSEKRAGGAVQSLSSGETVLSIVELPSLV